MTSPYATAVPFLGGSNPTNVIGDDIERVKAYTFYDAIYKNIPDTFEITMRGDDDDQVKIYIPCPKANIEAINRYLCKDFDFVVDPASGGTAESQMALDIMLRNLFKRERLYSKFATNRRKGLIRGDAMFHITADDTKEEGKRISVHILNPSQYFPIADPFNPDRIAGCHLVDTVQDPRAKDDKNKTVARRQTYRKTQDALGNFTGEITSELTLWEVGKWDDRQQKAADMKLVSSLRPEEPLNPAITQIPVYHWKNEGDDDGESFGRSALAGMETLFNGMNQAISDQDLTLVMQGLGMYWTDAAPPQDEDGEDTSWTIGPRQVIEVSDGQNFGRVTGVTTVAPFKDHIEMIEDRVATGMGVPDVAAGKVDVSIAESGIALSLRLSPLIAANQERELEILGIMDQMLHDLVTMWFPAYEGFTADCLATVIVGDPMPVNREARINEILGLVSNIPPLITIAQAQTYLQQYGYKFQDGDDAAVIAEAQAIAAGMDPYANRSAEENDDGGTQ
jgi:hypothetical protein